MLARKAKMKNRTIVLFDKAARKFYVGSSAVAISKRCDRHFNTISALAKSAELAVDSIFENDTYLVHVTDDFIRGGPRGPGGKGNFAY